jgi:hypothetical protein
MHACTHTHARTRTRMHARLHACTHTRTRTRMHAHTHACTHARTHARTHACTHAHARTRTRTHACTRTHTHTHTCTRTHARTRAHRRTHLRSCAVVACVGADAVLRSNLIGTPTSGPDVAGVSELQCRRRCGRVWAQSRCRCGRGAQRVACCPTPWHAERTRTWLYIGGGDGDSVTPTKLRSWMRLWHAAFRRCHKHRAPCSVRPVGTAAPTHATGALAAGCRAGLSAGFHLLRRRHAFTVPKQGRAQRGLSLAAAPTGFHCAQTGQGSARAFTCCGADMLSLCPNRAGLSAGFHLLRRRRAFTVPKQGTFRSARVCSTPPRAPEPRVVKEQGVLPQGLHDGAGGWKYLVSSAICCVSLRAFQRRRRRHKHKQPNKRNRSGASAEPQHTGACRAASPAEYPRVPRACRARLISHTRTNLQPQPPAMRGPARIRAKRGCCSESEL